MKSRWLEEAFIAQYNIFLLLDLFGNPILRLWPSLVSGGEMEVNLMHTIKPTSDHKMPDVCRDTWWRKKLTEGRDCGNKRCDAGAYLFRFFANLPNDNVEKIKLQEAQRPARSRGK